MPLDEYSISFIHILFYSVKVIMQVVSTMLENTKSKLHPNKILVVL